MLWKGCVLLGRASRHAQCTALCLQAKSSGDAGNDDALEVAEASLELQLAIIDTLERWPQVQSSTCTLQSDPPSTAAWLPHPPSPTAFEP